MTTLTLRSKPRFRRLRKLALTFTALYAFLLVLVIFFHAGDYLIYHANMAPWQIPPDVTPHPLAGSEGTIAVFTAQAGGEESQPVALYILSFPGNHDRAEHHPAALAREWSQATGFRVEVWAANLPGSGDSAGPPYLDRIAPLALATFDTLASHAGGKPIVLDCNSLGTTAALAIASQRHVAALVLRNPPPLAQLIRGEHSWWNLGLLSYPVSWMVPSALDSIANAGRCKVPALFILSQDDEIVPEPYHRMITAAYAGPVTVVPIAGSHNARVTDAEEEQIQAVRKRLVDLPREITPEAKSER